MDLLGVLSKSISLSDYLHQHIQIISEMTQEEFTYKNEYAITKTSSNYYNEICLQRKIAADSEVSVLGIEELSMAMANMSPDAPITMRFIDSPHWSGRIYFTTGQELIGVSIGRKINPDWKTPPDWDGSLKMTEDFNNK
ncbi:hypothetical protein [Aquipseudomonas ullengensis]|uniref:Uncharacterized protein n=1 Tax=Aquipseudomonas ullengensis TaxID=2759166 RepID=A0A7W4LJB3_9GAMM|nr:hypothetical protein [Pseudomonas ullengensis]MBB2494210.1 hypothetical protein [Pseudomonas ullengensis]